MIFTALRLRLIRWKQPGNGTASGVQARRRQSEHKEPRETLRCRRVFVTRTKQKTATWLRPSGRDAQKPRRLGKPARWSRQKCLSYVLAERKIRLYSRHICVVDPRCFGQPAFAFGAFRRQQMASRGTRPQHLATGSDLETFRHCFARFAACNRLRHTN